MSKAEIPLEQRRSAGLGEGSDGPTIRPLPTTQPLVWLRMGWQDLRSNALLSAGYGVVFMLAGYELLFLAKPRPYLFTVTVSGFMLVAPLLAAGLYEISRRHGEGMTTNFRESVEGWARNSDAMAIFGLVLVLIVIAWERLSAILFALFYGGELPDVESFLATIFLSGNYVVFVTAYVVVGALLAALVFSISAISVPMLVDREIDVVTAITTSLKAVRQNPAAMMLWAALLVAMMALGFATLLVGMVVLLPWAAHASWHAYRDLTQP
jgi:uncharacterized membrane protein